MFFILLAYSLTPDVLNGPLSSDIWRYYYCLVESLGGYSSRYIVLCRGENRYHDSEWELIRVILFYRVILYCRI